LGLAGLAYGLLAVAWARPASLSPSDTVPDAGDPLHLAWVMAWDAHALVRQPLALFESNAFHPYPHSLAFADHLLPEAVMVAPVQWLTGNPILASNLALLLALTLSALAMLALLVDVTGSWTAGFLGGLAYAFNSFTLQELPRVHVLNLEWWPVAILFLLRFSQAGRARDAWAFAASVTLQGLSGTYYLVYSVLLGPFWLLAAYLGARRRPSAVELARLALPLAAAGSLVAVVLRPYRELFRSLGFEKGWAGGADLLSYLDPPPRSWLWAAFDLGTRSEIPHFLGFIGAVLIVLGAVSVLRGLPGRGRAGLGLLALATFVLGLTLSLGPLIHVGGRLLGGGPYDFVYWHLPFAKAMASPERIGVLAVLGGAILVGLGASRLLVRLGERSGAWVLGLAVLLPLEHWTPARPGAAVPAGASVPAVYGWLRAQPREPVVDLPLYPDRAKRLWAVYLYLSTYHWQPIPIGRTSFYPPAHDFLAYCLRGFPDDISLAALDRVGVSTVIVHPWTWSALDRPDRLAALESHPRLELVRAFSDRPPARYAELGLGDEQVYRLRPATSLAQACEPAAELPRQAWVLRSTGVNKEERLRDGDPRTAWMTGRPQKPGDHLEVVLGSPEPIAAAALGLTYPFDEFPRSLVLSGRSEGDDGWHRISYADGPAERVATLGDLLLRPRDARFVVRFPPERLTAVRLALGSREADPSWPRWAVSDLRLYRECR
jgi:hypothetical protein